MLTPILSHFKSTAFGILLVLTFGSVLNAQVLNAQATASKNTVANSSKNKSSSQKLEYAIAIHGGAGSSPTRFSAEANAARADSMKKALEIGVEILKNGGSSLDAVEKVVRYLENDSQFNAGKGAVFNAEGGHELDASIMDGKNKACGAVAGVTTIKNPISLARRVMTNTRHVLLSGPGAEAFAKSFPEIKKVENKYFDTERSRKAWERTQRLRKKTGASNHNNQTPIAAGGTASYIGTVGCVALDNDGNLAAATSTGGLTNKKFGRIGDSPIIGAGTFADNKTCAVSCTGIGEQFIRNAVAYNVSARLRFLNQPIEKSVQAVLNEDLKKGDGGIIAVDRDGNISMEYTTSGMARAAADSAGRFEVIWVEHKKQTSKQKN